MGGEKRHRVLIILVIMITSIAVAAAANSTTVPAVYVFGDSYVDTGNNNYILTTIMSNYRPYGIDFINGTPTGRNSNGLLIDDLIVKYLGIKQLEPPYLKPNLSIEELKTGVTFASAGTGYDPLTAAVFNLIVMKKQAQLFGELKTKLVAAIGTNATENITRNALYFVNCGINDIVNNYYRYPIRPIQYTIEEYQQFLINLFREFVQILLENGARKFAIAGVPPLGCFPVVINMYSPNPKTDRQCIANITAAGRGFNQKLQDELRSLQTRYNNVGAKFIYLNQDQIVSDLILNPNQYGFANVNNGCCNSNSQLCIRGILSIVCPDRSKFVFWDNIHLTENATTFVMESYRPNIDVITSA